MKPFPIVSPPLLSHIFTLFLDAIVDVVVRPAVVYPYKPHLDALSVDWVRVWMILPIYKLNISVRMQLDLKILRDDHFVCHPAIFVSNFFVRCPSSFVWRSYFGSSLGPHRCLSLHQTVCERNYYFANFHASQFPIDHFVAISPDFSMDFCLNLDSLATLCTFQFFFFFCFASKLIVVHCLTTSRNKLNQIEFEICIFVSPTKERIFLSNITRFTNEMNMRVFLFIENRCDCFIENCLLLLTNFLL